MLHCDVLIWESKLTEKIHHRLWTTGIFVLFLIVLIAFIIKFSIEKSQIQYPLGANINKLTSVLSLIYFLFNLLFRLKSLHFKTQQLILKLDNNIAKELEE